MLQPHFEPTDEFAGSVPNILGHDGDNYPSQILQCSSTSPVPEKRLRPAVPVNAVVLGRYA